MDDLNMVFNQNSIDEAIEQIKENESAKIQWKSMIEDESPEFIDQMKLWDRAKVGIIKAIGDLTYEEGLEWEYTEDSKTVIFKEVYETDDVYDPEKSNHEIFMKSTTVVGITLKVEQTQKTLRKEEFSKSSTNQSQPIKPCLITEKYPDESKKPVEPEYTETEIPPIWLETPEGKKQYNEYWNKTHIGPTVGIVGGLLVGGPLGMIVGGALGSMNKTEDLKKEIERVKQSPGYHQYCDNIRMHDQQVYQQALQDYDVQMKEYNEKIQVIDEKNEKIKEDYHAKHEKYNAEFGGYIEAEKIAIEDFNSRQNKENEKIKQCYEKIHNERNEEIKLQVSRLNNALSGFKQEYTEWYNENKALVDDYRKEQRENENENRRNTSLTNSIEKNGDIQADAIISAGRMSSEAIREAGAMISDSNYRISAANYSVQQAIRDSSRNSIAMHRRESIRNRLFQAAQTLYLGHKIGTKKKS